MVLRRIVVSLVALAALSSAPRGAMIAAGAAWTQWGGPNRNFMSDATGLASTWPAGGPRKLWTRALGEGHSSILVEGESPVHHVPAGGTADSHQTQSGGGRRSDGCRDRQSGLGISLPCADRRTRFLARRRAARRRRSSSATGLYATSSRRELFALDKTTGKLLWSHDFIKEYGAHRPVAGTPAVRSHTKARSS